MESKRLHSPRTVLYDPCQLRLGVGGELGHAAREWVERQAVVALWLKVNRPKQFIKVL